MGSQRVGDDWVTELNPCFKWSRILMPVCKSKSKLPDPASSQPSLFCPYSSLLEVLWAGVSAPSHPRNSGGQFGPFRSSILMPLGLCTCHSPNPQPHPFPVYLINTCPLSKKVQGPGFHAGVHEHLPYAVWGTVDPGQGWPSGAATSV